MTLHKMFTDNMVLQANKPVRLFGKGSGVAKVRFCGKTYPAMRIFVQERIGEYEGIKSDNGWLICEKKTLGECSAIGYHVARLLHENKGMAVGIIGCYQGASIIENARFVETKDVSETDNIHPIDKRIVSERVYNVLFEGEA